MNFISSQIESVNLKFNGKNERKILKAFLLGHLHQLFCELIQGKFKNNNYTGEHYEMDSKVTQLFIHSIIETGEYNLEGISYHTRIPFDVLYDIACGVSTQFSISSWAKIVELYIQVKPDITELLINRLLEILKKNPSAFSSLINEPH